MLDACDTAATADAAGDRLEDLISYVFEKFPGITLHERNILDAPRAHEIDLAFWHLQAKSPVGFLDPIVIVECKNTGTPVGSRDVGWFVRKLQDHGANVGIFVALAGITGAQAGNANAHSEVLAALVRDRIKILLLDRDDLARLTTTDDGTLRARENVVHEAGLFQGRLGFTRAIIVLEDGCQEFSNIHGLGQIRFPKGRISAAFEEIRQVLERENLVEPRT